MKKGLLYGISKRGGCPQFVFRVRLLNVLICPGVKTKYIYLYKQELIRIINNHDKSSGDLEELYKIMKRRRERERERERQRRAYQQPLKKRRVCIYQYIYICL